MSTQTTITEDGNVVIPETLSSITGNLRIGSARLHSYGTSNTFCGENSGNYTMTGSANNGFGQQTLNVVTSGQLNTAMGHNTLEKLTSGNFNVGLGSCALCAVTTEDGNTAVGNNALANAAGAYNVALGVNAGFDLLTGNRNIYIDNRGIAAESNTIRIGNIAHGLTYLHGIVRIVNNGLETNYIELPATAGNTIGLIRVLGSRLLHTTDPFGTADNVFLGRGAGNFTLTTSTCTTGIGPESLRSLTTGNCNTACGHSSGANITTGSNNALVGFQAGLNVTTGFNNVFVGVQSGSNTNSSESIGIGNRAGAFRGGSANISIGTLAGEGLSNGTSGGITNLFLGVECGRYHVTGDRNIMMGYRCGITMTTGTNNIILANDDTIVSGDNRIIIGNSSNSSFTARGIFGSTSSGGTAVFVNSSGVLGTLTSKKESKQNIENIGLESHSIIHDLRPVKFEYKDDPGIRQYGLIAEEVHDVDPELIITDENDEINTVKYHDINILLLKEVQRMRKEIDSLQDELYKLKNNLFIV